MTGRSLAAGAKQFKTTSRFSVFFLKRCSRLPRGVLAQVRASALLRCLRDLRAGCCATSHPWSAHTFIHLDAAATRPPAPARRHTTIATPVGSGAGLPPRVFRGAVRPSRPPRGAAQPRVATPRQRSSTGPAPEATPAHHGSPAGRLVLEILPSRAGARDAHVFSAASMHGCMLERNLPVFSS